ncbi:hypothetical protein [Paenisporosarcina cavernae]|uniref:Uncharacterized protein n=1 Tax=Paenisporosarcina cavernae TaxID=2320858 RepID=A0A385YUG8_9BACL|nr:hypothetical protein [Paenisporosarcina cavernae]AYC30326.1 hypothetical protein D3873_10880 [Paenisporosarcina cavernae]
MSEETPKKKMSLKEAMQAQLEAKKNKQANQKGGSSLDTSGKKMQSQAVKKVSNTRRKMGS